MEYRLLPRTDVSVSTIGLAVPARATPWETRTALSPAGLIQRAHAVGVSLIDATWRKSPGELLGMVQLSARKPPRLVMMVGLDPEAPRAPLKKVLGSDDDRVLLPMLRNPSSSALASTQLTRQIEEAVASLEAPLWGVAWASAAEAAMAAGIAIDAGARILALPASLIGYAEAEQVGLLAERAGVGVVGLDPMASGALDGSFLVASPLDRGAALRPSSVSELSSQLAPVTRLGFLTDTRRRTLAQAAAKFVLGLPGVVSVSCEFRSPQLLDELGRLDAVPAISTEERERLERLGPISG